MGTQLWAKSKSNSQIYIVSFFLSGRVVINAKDFRKKLLKIHIPQLYNITFDVKGVTKLIHTTSESKPYHLSNNKTTFKIRKILTTLEMGKILRTGIISKIILLKSQTSDNNKQGVTSKESVIFKWHMQFEWWQNNNKKLRQWIIQNIN